MQGGQEEMKCMNARPHPVDVFGDERRQLQGLYSYVVAIREPWMEDKLLMVQRKPTGFP